MSVHHTLLAACIAFALSGCSGETVSQGVDKLGGVRDWFEGQDGNPSSGGGNASTITLVPAAAVASEAANENAEQANSEIDNVGNINTEQIPTATPYVESVFTNSEELIPVPESETSQLTTDSEFLFRTAKTLRLKVNIASATGTQASLSLCTEFEETDAGFEINYDSCPVRGAVNNGQFESEIVLVNQFDSAIAVIWFPYQESEPMYRTFEVENNAINPSVHEWLWYEE